MQKKIHVISQMYFIHRARESWFFHIIHIFFLTKLFRRKKLCDRNIESISVRWGQQKWGLGFYRHPCNKIERMITRDTRISVWGNSAASFVLSRWLCHRLFSDRVPRPVIVRPGESFFFFFFFHIFFSHWFTIRNFVKRPRVADLRLVVCSNSLFHPVAVYSISRAMRVSTIYIAVVRDRSPWRYTHRSVARDRFRLSTTCVVVCVHVRCTYLDVCDGAKEERPVIDWL